MRQGPASRAVIGLSPSEAAAHWRVRHDAGDMGADELLAFDAWLAESPANASAWTRAEMAWALFDSARSDPHLEAMRNAALASEVGWPAWRWAAVAASLIVLVLTAALLFASPASTPEATRPLQVAAQRAEPPSAARPQHAYETNVGQRLRSRLSDGTIVTLNTNSALDVAFVKERRIVRLLRGQALFEVAKDRHRPFVVEAAGREITALGTVFEVRLDPGGMHVLLAEGKVSIVRAHFPGGGGSGAGRQVVLRPGQSFVARLGELESVRPANVESALLWRNGLIDFDDVTLAEAAAELNRYSTRRLVVRDPRVASLRVSGVFRAGAPERFTDAVREVLPVAVQRRTDEVELVEAEPAPAH